MPARLRTDDYPALVPYNHPVDTIAVGAVLVVANLQPASDRYRNVVNFVDAFFTDFQSLLLPGHNPKWHEVKIATELSGWGCASVVRAAGKGGQLPSGGICRLIGWTTERTDRYAALPSEQVGRG